MYHVWHALTCCHHPSLSQHCLVLRGLHSFLHTAFCVIQKPTQIPPSLGLEPSSNFHLTSVWYPDFLSAYHFSSPPTSFCSLCSGLIHCFEACWDPFCIRALLFFSLPDAALRFVSLAPSVLRWPSTPTLSWAISYLVVCFFKLIITWNYLHIFTGFLPP